MIAGSIRSGDSFRRLRSPAWGPLVAIFAAAVLVGLVSARRADAMQLTPVQKQEMKLHYEKATRAYDVQKYGEAVEEYQKAYEIGGDPAMLYNVAQSYRLNDQIPEALRFYRRYLQRSPNARNRDDVERKISDLEKTLEDRRKAAAAAAAPSTPPPPVAVTPAPTPEPEIRQESGSSGLRIAGIVVAAVGGAALITFGITGKMASDNGQKLTDASVSGGTFDPSWESNGKSLNTIAIVSAIAGGAAVVTGVVMIALSGGKTTEQPRSALAPMVGPGGTMGASAVVRF